MVPGAQPIRSMPYSGGRLSTFLMSSLVVSSVAFRPEALRAGRKVDATRLQQASKRCLSSGFRCRTSRTSRHHQQTPKRVLSPPSTSVLSIKSTALPLWANTQLGTVRISARSALRLLTSSIPPKRVRVVTDIDDTVKSSGNKRLLGIPLGGIDAQCEKRPERHGAAGPFVLFVACRLLGSSILCIPSDAAAIQQ